MLALLIVCVLTPSVATAESVTVPDPREDRMRIEMETGQFTPAPKRVTADILRTRFRHTPLRIRVRVTFTDLQSTVAWAQYQIRIVTNEGGTAGVRLLAMRGHVPLAIAGEMPRDAPCPLHRSIDYVNNVVVIWFCPQVRQQPPLGPHGCLRPRK